MSKHRDDGEMSHKSTEHEKSHKKSDGGAMGPDEGTPRNKRAIGVAPGGDGHDGGAVGPDEGTPRSDAQPEKHAEFGDGAHKHSNHMPTSGDQPNC